MYGDLHGHIEHLHEACDDPLWEWQEEVEDHRPLVFVFCINRQILKHLVQSTSSILYLQPARCCFKIKSSLWTHCGNACCALGKSAFVRLVNSGIPNKRSKVLWKEWKIQMYLLLLLLAEDEICQHLLGSWRFLNCVPIFYVYLFLRGDHPVLAKRQRGNPWIWDVEMLRHVLYLAHYYTVHNLHMLLVRWG